MEGSSHQNESKDNIDNQASYLHFIRKFRSDYGKKDYYKQHKGNSIYD